MIPNVQICFKSFFYINFDLVSFIRAATLDPSSSLLHSSSQEKTRDDAGEILAVSMGESTTLTSVSRRWREMALLQAVP